MSAPGWFGQHAQRLAAAGYDVIPISLPDDRTYDDPGKQPAQRYGWAKGCPQEQWNRFAHCGLGILTKTTPALDIDVLDAELSASIQAIADHVLGDAPYRIGQPPKRLLPFQLRGKTFCKMKVSWRGLGDELHDPTKPPAVELLSGGEKGGQQFVALGIHPRTRQPYRWHRDPDLSLPRGLLPPLDQARAERFMRTLTKALKSIGATDLKLTGVRVERKCRPVRRPAPQTADAERVLAALEAFGNRDLHYDEWIRIGHAIKAALPGGDGLAIWERWSSLSNKNDPALTRRKWATFNPHSIGAGTIFHLAREAAR